MTTELTIQNLFEGKEIRTVEATGEPWLCLADLAVAWGIDRTTPLNIIRRNEDIFQGVLLAGDVTSQTGLCVNERGLYLLMGKITASRLKNPASKEVIIRFQRWVPELIQKYRKKEIVQASKGPDYAEILDAIKFVKEMAGIVGTEPLPLYCQILDKHDLGYLGGLLVVQKEPIVKPIALPKPKDYLTATDIGERAGKTAYEVHMFMYQHKPPLLIKESHTGEWRLTPFGKEFGEERSFDATKGNIKWWIAWKKDVLRLFNIYDHVEMG